METEKQTVEAPVKQKKGFVAPKAIGVILAILLTLFIVIGLVGFNVWRVFFNAPLVKETLTNEVVSTDLVPATLEVFSEWRAQQRVENNESLSGVNEPDIVLLISFMKADEWREIKQLLISDEFVTQIVSDSVDGLYAWIDSDEIWPDVTWNMTLLKERMSGPEGKEAIMIAYHTLPEATEEQIADFEHRLSQVPEGVEVLYNLAQFPEPWYQDQVADYVDALKSANDNIPETFHFSEEFGGDSDAQAANLWAVKGLLRLIRLIAVAGWIVALSLAVLILILNVRSRRTLGKYIGIPLLIGGALALLIALAGQTLVTQVVTGGMLSAISDFARIEIGNSIRRLTSLFFQPLLLQSSILAGLGLLLIVQMAIKNTTKIPAASEQEETATLETDD